YYTIPQNL
ncbi:unnamed protein product, partial [Rotaria sordida]